MTLEIAMPEMNGIEVLEAMAARGSRTGVVVLSSLTARGSKMTMRALELGAFDFITKPQGGTAAENLKRLRELLTPIVRAFERRQQIREGGAGAATPRVIRQSGATRVVRIDGVPIVLIGVSTGGPGALAQLIPALPAKLAAPVFIVQHMPPLFTSALAESLQAKSELRVTEAKDGEIAEAGKVVYIAQVREANEDFRRAESEKSSSA